MFLECYSDVQRWQVGQDVMNVMKDEFSSNDSSEMKVGELDWSPDEHRWGKRREGQEASSLGLEFELLPGESPAGAMRRVHDAVKAR